MTRPLLIHLIFHPKSQAARAMAVHLHNAFNKDLLLPGLRLPTVILPEDGSALAPVAYAMDGARKHVAIVLADDQMAIEAPHPSHPSWPEFVADLADTCAAKGHRFIPIQLSENAWPLDERLQETNFVRSFAQSDAERPAWTERRIVIEICLFLLGQARGEQAPVEIFLSHAKQDIDAEPKLFDAMVDHLKATQPVSGWVDSGGIQAGAKFPDVIEAAVRGRAMLVLGTANYSSRSWCRREVLFAKKHSRPLVVVDGLNGSDTRSFPYVGNVPVTAWSANGAQRAVDLLLKEWLRQLHVQEELKETSRPGDCVLAAPPELATVVGVPRGTCVLYPDPPLGDEELAILEPLGHVIETPLQRAAKDRPLTQKLIALSISESDSIAAAGLLPAHLDDALLEISRHLLLKGATLVYGGHLGSDGYTIALFELVRAHKGQSVLPPVARIVNYVGWPTPLPDSLRAKYARDATFVRVPRPDGIAALEPATFVEEPQYFPASNPERRFAWSRGMTQMRRRQTADIQARIVLGGKAGPTVTALADGEKKFAWYSGRIPGVLEETILSLQARQPVYICGGFGGAAAIAGELLQGRTPEQFTWAYQRQAPFSDELKAMYESKAIAWEDYDRLAEQCKDVGLANLSQCNGLSVEENLELMRSRDLPRIVSLLLKGLGQALA